MKLKFTVDEHYLIYQLLLADGSQEKISQSAGWQNILDFQNFAWKESQQSYNFLIGRNSPESLAEQGIKNLSSDLLTFFSTVKKNTSYQKIFSETQAYAQFCETQWEKNFTQSSTIVAELLGNAISGDFTAFIVHPTLHTGRYLGNNQILWGHPDDWENYATVYLWHEILHSQFEYTDLDQIGRAHV